MLPAIRSGTHARLPVTNRRKVGMTSSHHAPYVQGYTRATLAGTEGCDTARWSESLKAGLGSDCRLKLACMKAELLVIADQQCRGDYVPGPCTHRPSADLENCTAGANVITGITGRALGSGFDHRQDKKGTRWMPWHQESKKGVDGCDKPR